MKRTQRWPKCLILALSFLAPASARDAVVTHGSTARTQVRNLQTLRHDSCGSFMYYMGVARETDIRYGFIPIRTDAYEVEVPLSIVERVSRSNQTAKGLGETRFDVRLGDGTVITGFIVRVGYFVGQTGLGDFKVPVGEVNEIVFGDAPATTIPAPTQAKSPEGQGNATLRTNDGKDIPIESVSFWEEQANRNECFTGDQPVAQLTFGIGGSEQRVNWRNLRSIQLVSIERRTPFVAGATVTLTDREGSKYEATAPLRGFVQGMATFGTSKFVIRIPFAGKYDLILFDSARK